MKLYDLKSIYFPILSILFTFVYLLGALNMYFSDKNNYCLMTYMFEFPQFVGITVPENSIYPQYGLYAYSEGRFTERARKMWFDGVPVLFLPGNSGSHMQVRSLASVALRKALTKGNDYHFDFFTINYNEELSGLYGGVLERQTKYASACIEKILSLYKSNKYTKNVPKSVILIGHSMGGVIAKRLLAYPGTINSTSIAITLAAPVQAPAINFDDIIDYFYTLMETEWEMNVNKNEEIKNKKLLLSFGGGPRDILMPSLLTLSNESYISALTTAVPGVWASTDHVSIVWCKQMVMAINKYLFSIINPSTGQISEERQILTSKAKQFFQANRSMFLNPELFKPNATMLADAFWYEDNRRIYQISRPEIDKTTYLMIRLVSFPQNRFVAIESVNVDDKDWIFGCSAKYTYHTYRYCKYATVLTELSRWTGVATDFGKRKLATIHLHDLKDQYRDWSHVVVKVSPTRKPVVLNVDVNDYASRQIRVDLPSFFSMERSTIKAETEPGSLYYELLLPDFNAIHEAYLLYVEPTANCKAVKYHVSAELHVPWAKDHEYYHYFTQLKHSPMKLRLYVTNPNITLGKESQEYPKITLLLDPQCTFTISISSSWYHRLAQLARHYTPVLVPYVGAIVLLVAKSNIMHLKKHGTCLTLHGALMSDGVKPYNSLVFGMLAATALLYMPFLPLLFDSANLKNLELLYFSRSLMVLPTYMTALGILNIIAALTLGLMICSSQLANRLLFRIVWRGSGGFAEKVALGLQRIPTVVSVILVSAVPLSCGAASLVVGGAFYAFLLSKMFEEYLEDYVYKFIAKVASRICRRFKAEKKISTESESSLIKINSSSDTTSENVKAIKDNKDIAIKRNEIGEVSSDIQEVNKGNKNEDKPKEEKRSAISMSKRGKEGLKSQTKCDESSNENASSDKDDELNNLNFHVMMFFMWMTVAIVNLPALLTWARNFKYSMVLKPDTSYHVGMIMSGCSTVIWRMEKPRRNLKYYEGVSTLLFTMAVIILAVGPLSFKIVNYGVTIMFLIITLQQLLDKEESPPFQIIQSPEHDSSPNREEKRDIGDENIPSENENENEGKTERVASTESEDCDVCNENRIYNLFKRLKEKFSFNEDI